MLIKRLETSEAIKLRACKAYRFKCTEFVATTVRFRLNSTVVHTGQVYPIDTRSRITASVEGMKPLGLIIEDCKSRHGWQEQCQHLSPPKKVVCEGIPLPFLILQALLLSNLSAMDTSTRNGLEYVI